MVRHGIDGKHLVFLTHLEHDDVALLAGQIEPAAGSQGRGLELVGIGQAFLVVEGFSGPGVEAADQSPVRQDVELPVVIDGGGGVGVAPLIGPEDRVRVGQVALPVQSNGQHVGAAVPRHHDHGILVTDRNGNRVGSQPAAFPDQVAVGKVVTADLVVSGDDDLGRPRVFRDQGRGPGAPLVPVPAPQLLTRVFVQGENEGLALMVEVEDQGVAVKNRRRALTETVAHSHLHAEVLFPGRLPVQVVDVEAPGTEEGVDVTAVGGRRVGGEASVTPVVPLVGRLHDGSIAPQGLAGVLVQAQDLELVLDLSHGHPPAAFPSATPTFPAGPILTSLCPWTPRGPREFTSARLRHGSRRDCGCEVDPVFPDDGGGMALSGDGSLPLDVFGRAPSHRRSGAGHARMVRTPPVGPLFIEVRRRRRGGGQNPHQDAGTGQICSSH